MSEDSKLWEWVNDPEITNKKCEFCSQPFRFDRNAIITYQGKNYHSHCALDFLTLYHCECSEHK